MHEMSVAQSLVEIIHQNVPNGDLPNVRAVKLKVGALSGVVPDSLEFSFSVITAETPLREARLDIEHIPFTIHCTGCGKDSSPTLGIVLCPACGSGATQVLSGTELQVSEIELTDFPEGSP
jgi:hydrogenase nickel incorporation protein HypA/HybF